MAGVQDFLGFFVQEFSLFPEDGKKLLTASNDRTLRVWEVRDDTEVTADGSFKKGPVASTKRTLRGHSDVVSQAILETGSWVIVEVVPIIMIYYDKESIVLFSLW